MKACLVATVACQVVVELRVTSVVWFFPHEEALGSQSHLLA